MAELTLISPRKRQLKPLVEAALRTELRLLEVGIRRTEQKVQEFETRYGLPSAEFIRRYEQDELEETLEFAEWIGEYRLLQRLREKANTLQEIRFAN
jgi:phage shock protein A